MTKGRRVLMVVLALVLAFLIAPLIVVVISSFSSGPVMEFPPPGFTTRWYGTIRPEFYHAALVSLGVATSTTLLSVVLGLPAGLALCRGRFPGRAMIGAICLSPLMIPALVTGVALYQSAQIFWDYTGITLGGTLPGIMIGHMVFGIPFVVRAVVAGHARLDPALEEAAQNLGAAPLTAFRLAALPVLRPALVSGAVFAFAMSFDDVPIALFMGGGDWATTLPVQIFTTVQFNLSADVMAVATLVVLVSFGAVALLSKVAGSDLLFGVKS